MAKKKIAKKQPNKTSKPAKPKIASKKRTAKKQVAKKKQKIANSRFEGFTIRDCKRVAKSTFRIETLHAQQIEAMRAVLNGKDTIAVLPTGFGKSLIYQTLACLVDQPTITISPLIALMRDQENALRRAGVQVLRIDSTLGKRDRDEALKKLRNGGSLVLLTTPESLEAQDVRRALRKSPPALLTIDEAHCISEWGHDFRPAYLGLGNIREKLGNPTVLALTATATVHVQDDIAARTKMDKPVKVIAPPHRSNLRFDVRKVPGSIKLTVAGKLIRKLRRPGIIYCSTT
ncbi:MAG: DEAD/DEAH box helicase, partial [Pseudomonadota bacterium]